jgi:predicted HicB family RNase H-like nuclease
MPENKPRKVGRPKLPKGKALGKPTPIRFQDDERATFEKAAKKEGLTLSEWIRQTLKQAIRQ